MHVYLATTKRSYVDNGKHVKANTQVMEALRHTLSKDQFSMISHCDSAFTVWNILTSPEQQTTNYVAMVDESDEACYIIQGNESLEVH